MSNRSELDLKRMIAASGITLDELSQATGIHVSTLSRAANGLRLDETKQRKIASALAEALTKQTREVRIAKRTVARIVEGAQTAAA